MRRLQAVIITGISGSGKSSALKAFEDMGYFCVDNLPIALLPDFFRLSEETTTSLTKVALVMDVREEGFLTQYPMIFSSLKKDGFHLEILFLDSNDSVLIQRYSQTRRGHPLQPRGDIASAIALERSMLSSIKEAADRLLDTSNLNVHQLRKSIFDLYAQRERLDRLAIHVLSFGFKYGVPADANLVFDVRFLPNPYFEPGMRSLTGCDDAVYQYVLDCKETHLFMQHLTDMIDFLLPRFKDEGKSYLVIAIGCTGGHHRSVVVARALEEYLAKSGEDVLLTHRDIRKET